MFDDKLINNERDKENRALPIKLREEGHRENSACVEKIRLVDAQID
jgi:hypothetical protein